MKSHPHHRGGGLPEFRGEHKEKKIEDINYADMKYGSEFGAVNEYRNSVDAMNSYIRKNKEKH